MTIKDIDKIREIAEKLKKAFYKADRSNLTIEFEDFPFGSCGASSYILYFFLEQEGYKNIKYVCGEKGSQSHAWLEVNDLIVDITIQQFDNAIIDVVFLLSSSIHKKFKVTEKYIIQKPDDESLINIPYLKELM